MNRAVINALNAAVPRPYKRAAAGAIGSKIYKPTENPKAIITALQANYGQMRPGKNTIMEQKWSAPWNPVDPIEILFDTLEDCYVLSVSAKPAYTAEKMIDKGITAIKHTGLYLTTLVEWKALELADQSWSEFNAHFTEAYEVCLQSGGGGNNPYHGASNVHKIVNNESITTITQSMANIQHANNTNAQTMSDSMSAMTSKVDSINWIIQQHNRKLRTWQEHPSCPRLHGLQQHQHSEHHQQ